MFQPPYKDLIADEANVTICSEKCLNASFRKVFPANIYLPLNDHCDFNNLISFIKIFNPHKIYLEHVRTEEFSYSLQKNLENIKILNLENSY